MDRSPHRLALCLWQSAKDEDKDVVNPLLKDIFNRCPDKQIFLEVVEDLLKYTCLSDYIDLSIQCSSEDDFFDYEWDWDYEDLMFGDYEYKAEPNEDIHILDDSESLTDVCDLSRKLFEIEQDIEAMEQFQNLN